jgi:glucosamine-6-phosphate deaminase
MAMLEALTSIPDLPWNKMVGFHMDEYLGISDQHPASFRRYLRERLTDKVKMRQFYGVGGGTDNPEEVLGKYADLLQQQNPQLCLLGIGERPSCLQRSRRGKIRRPARRQDRFTRSAMPAAAGKRRLV